VDELELELKQVLVEALSLEDGAADDLSATEPLFDQGLGLDSLDALQLGVELKRRYGIVVDAKDPEARRHFESVRTLARFVAAHRAP
jgi:acyl carrier protein